jgi:hypothetical protein
VKTADLLHQVEPQHLQHITLTVALVVKPQIKMVLLQILQIPQVVVDLIRVHITQHLEAEETGKQ